MNESFDRDDAARSIENIRFREQQVITAITIPLWYWWLVAVGLSSWVWSLMVAGPQ